MPTASALEKARLQQQVLSRISSSPWVRQGDVDAVCRLITREVAELLDIARVSVWFFNEGRDELHLADLYERASQQHSKGAVLSKAAFGPEFEYLLFAKYVDAHDPYTDPRTQGYADAYLRPNGISAMLDAVVRVGEELLGLVCLEHVGREHRWDESEIVFTSQLGDQVALTHSMARTQAVTAELRTHQHELQLLNEQLEQRVSERTAALAAATDSLLASERMASLGAVVAGVAHDLNSPIGNALLVANSLHERTRHFLPQLASGRVQRSALEQFLQGQLESARLMERTLQHAADLVKSFKSVTADQASGARRRFLLHEVVHDVLGMLNPGLRRAACSLRVDCQLPQGLALDSYPGPLAQVIVNLINNAVLHAFEGMDEGLIRVQAQADGEGWLQLSVQDNGRGIPVDSLHRVFEPFYSTKFGQGGSGLGLHLVKTLVEQNLGGQVRLESRPGQGCTVLLRLPLQAPPTPSS